LVVDDSPDYDVFGYISDKNIYVHYSLQLNIKEESELKDLINFLDEVKEPGSFQFEAIYVHHLFFKVSYELVNELYRKLLEVKVHPNCIRFHSDPLMTEGVLEERCIEWCPRYRICHNWRAFKRIGCLEVDLSSEEQLHYLAEFETPIKQLCLKFDFHKHKIEDVKFSETILNSVIKLFVNFKEE
jgi:hypothetical protein